MKCKFCGAEVQIGQKCDYCDSIAEPIYYKDNKQTPHNKPQVEARQSEVHIVEQGDTLWGIARKYYADGTMYKKIAKANRLTDLKNIKIGQVLKLPK